MTKREWIKKFFTGFFVTLFIIFLLAVIAARIVQTKDNYKYTDTKIYVVQKGDTLWGIAEQAGDNRHDTRRTVYEIERLSNCKGTIHKGDKLIIPIYIVIEKED